jgi:hypothetical protein
VTATQEPVIPQPEPTMASVLQENEFLKSELEAYKQELARAKEAYEKELNLYTLARIATLSEGTTESLCKEYMCCQCGDIYYQAGYKVIQVPVPGAPPTPSPFVVKEEPAAHKNQQALQAQAEPAETQEPAGPPKLKTEPCIATNENPPYFCQQSCTDNAYGGIYTSQPDQSPPLLWNNLLRPYLIPLLATLKHRLSYGMSRQKYKNGRKSMLKHRPKACKCTDKSG